MVDTYRKWIGMFLAVFFSFCLWSGGKSCGQVQAAGHVFDEAGIFSGSETKKLEKLAQEMEETYDMNYLLMTAEEAWGMSSAELAEDFYETQGYDKNGRRGGAVFLIDFDNRELYVATNGDMIYYLTDERIERICDAGYDYASEGEYGQAMTAMLEQTAVYMKKGIPDHQYTYDTETGRVVRYKSLSAGEFGMAAAIALAAAALVCFLVYRRYSSVEKYEYAVGQNGDMDLTGKEDRLVNQFVTHRRIVREPPRGGGSGGGSFSGRSSTHTSSREGTFGGGGRKF
ncbi:MAG: TPM domain-containing protein [Eubacteriales bacterium]|nr:TPM domain-containing protein [Eubacteriales bacterium]